MADGPRFFERRGNLFRMQGSAQERFDPKTGAWVDVSPLLSDRLFDNDTETNEVDEATAKMVQPKAFAAASSS